MTLLLVLVLAISTIVIVGSTWIRRARRAREDPELYWSRAHKDHTPDGPDLHERHRVAIEAFLARTERSATETPSDDSSANIIEHSGPARGHRFHSAHVPKPGQTRTRTSPAQLDEMQRSAWREAGRCWDCGAVPMVGEFRCYSCKER